MLSSQGSNNSIFGVQQAFLIAYGVGGHILALFIVGFFYYRVYQTHIMGSFKGVEESRDSYLVMSQLH